MDFLSDAGDVRDWNLQGLPADAFSTENGVIVTRSNRWSLMIDPQVMEDTHCICCIIKSMENKTKNPNK